MGVCSPGSLPLYTVMFDAMLLSDLANKFSLSLSILHRFRDIIDYFPKFKEIMHPVQSRRLQERQSLSLLMFPPA